QIRKVLIRESLDPMRIPRFPRPEPVPPRTAQEGADNNRRNPQDLEAEQKSEDLVLPFLERVIAIPSGINVNVGNHHQANDDKRWRHDTGVPGIEKNQDFLQSEEVPRSLRRIGSTTRVRRFL